MSFLTDCAVLPDHVENDCANNLKGGFPSFAIVDRDHTITDWTNGSQWLANIAAGKIKITNRVKAELPPPSPIMSDNLVACGAVQNLDGFDWQFKCMDGAANVFNDEFYKTVNSKMAYLVLWNKDESQIQVIEKDVSFVCFPVSPGSNREQQYYDITGNFTSNEGWFPVRYTAPTGVFQF